MKALVLDEIGKIAYKDVTAPELTNPWNLSGENTDTALVKVHAAGICGSDIPRAYRNGAHRMPLILGHEFSGEVVRTDPDAAKSLIGKRVGVFPLIPCRKCPQCRTGHYEMCSNYDYLGSRCNGGFAEYVRVPVWNLLELPDNVTYEQAAMLEPMAVAVHAMRQLYTEPDRLSSDKILISGLGTIGLLLTMFLLDVGAKPGNVYVIGNKSLQKDMAVKLGIPAENYYDTKADPGHETISEWIKDKTSGTGVDAYFECIGITGSVEWGLDSLACGGKMCLVGNPASDIDIAKEVYWKILRRQIVIHGTWNSSYLGNPVEDEPAVTENIRDDWKYVLERLSKGCIHPEILITHRYSLEELIKGFELMKIKSEPYVKVMMVR